MNKPTLAQVIAYPVRKTVRANLGSVLDVGRTMKLPAVAITAPTIANVMTTSRSSRKARYSMASAVAYLYPLVAAARGKRVHDPRACTRRPVEAAHGFFVQQFHGLFLVLIGFF